MTDEKSSEHCHLVASIVSAPNLPFIQVMYEQMTRKAILHMWGDAELPETATIIVLVEGRGAPVESNVVTIVRTTYAEIEELIAAYKEVKYEGPEIEGHSQNGMMFAFGSPSFCQIAVRFWAAEPQGIAGWGENMLNKLEEAPPCTFVWMDGRNGEVHKANIMELADIEDASR